MKKYKNAAGKKVIAGILIAGMVLGLTACGDGKDNQGTDNNNHTVEQGGTENGGNGSDGNESGVTVDNTVSIDTIRTEIKEAYGDNYLPDVMLSEDEILVTFGIESEWYEEAIAEVPMISAQVDTLIAVKALPEHVADVTNAITAYQEYLKNDTMQYPMNISKIAASTIVTMDHYIFFIMLGVIDSELEEADEAEQIEAYTQQNQIAVDAIENVLLK